MIRVAISVEGATEFEFVQKILAPYFIHNYSISLTSIPLHGNVSLDRIESELKKLIPKYDYVTTFYDLYGFKGMSTDISANDLEELIGNKFLNNKKLIPYIQQYEFETLVLSDPAYYEEYFDDEQAKIAVERMILSCGGDVENINNSKETAPATRVIKLFDAFGDKYVKVFHGVSIIEDIGLDKVMQECSRFSSWIEKIKSLNKGKK